MPTVHFSQQSWTIITHIIYLYIHIHIHVEYTYTYIYICIVIFHHGSHIPTLNSTATPRSTATALRPRSPSTRRCPSLRTRCRRRRSWCPWRCLASGRRPLCITSTGLSQPKDRKIMGKTMGKSMKTMGKPDGFLEKNMKAIGKTMKNVWKSYGTRERWWFRKGLRNSVVVMGIRLE